MAYPSFFNGEVNPQKKSLNFLLYILNTFSLKMSCRFKSWVWHHGKRLVNKAYCDLCDNSSNGVFYYAGRSTGSFARHLKLIYNNSGNVQNRRYVHCFVK